MKIVTPDSSGRILIGRIGENQTVRVDIPVTGWADLYGSGTFTLVHQRSQDTAAYPITVTVVDETVQWTVSSADVQYGGYGKAELIYTVGTAIAKSVIYLTVCEESLDGTGTVPSAWQSWVDSVIAAKESAVAAKEDAEEAQEAAETAQEAAEEARDEILAKNYIERDGSGTWKLGNDTDGFYINV